MCKSGGLVLTIGDVLHRGIDGVLSLNLRTATKFSDIETVVNSAPERVWNVQLGLLTLTHLGFLSVCVFAGKNASSFHYE